VLENPAKRWEKFPVPVNRGRFPNVKTVSQLLTSRAESSQVIPDLFDPVGRSSPLCLGVVSLNELFGSGLRPYQRRYRPLPPDGSDKLGQ